MSKLTYLDLFSGIGAFPKALSNTNLNYELVGFSEIDKWAVQSYCAIHDVDESLNLGDISGIDASQLPSNIDLITHGSPCQDFSNAGLMKGGDKGSNTRSSLMWETVNIIKHIKPKYVVWENVKGVLNKNNKHNFQLYLDTLKILGYNNYWDVLNARDFGIPQNRERVFVVSIHKNIDSSNFTFPNVQHALLNISPILDDVVPDKYTISDKIWTSHQNRRRKHRARGNGFGYSLFSKDSEYINTISARYYKDGSEVLIYQEDDNPRRLTPLECWRFMGFEDEDYWKARRRLENVFYNGNDRSDSQMYKQAGNSIVVPVLEAIFEELLKESV